MIETIEVHDLLLGSAANGPGLRAVVWARGCPLACPGCFNPSARPLGGGTTWRIAELARRILDHPGLAGTTFSGGEPFAQAAAFAELARLLREDGHHIATYTGHTLASLERSGDPSVRLLLERTDLLIDGPYPGVSRFSSASGASRR